MNKIAAEDTDGENDISVLADVDALKAMFSEARTDYCLMNTFEIKKRDGTDFSGEDDIEA